MNYWITVHCPPREDQPKDRVAAGVWLNEKYQSAAVEFAAGDEILIYHPKTGKTIVEEQANGSLTKINCQQGRHS